MYFLDIDQTLSTDYRAENLVASIRHERDLSLKLPDVDTWPDLFQLSEVVHCPEPRSPSTCTVLSGSLLMGIRQTSREISGRGRGRNQVCPRWPGAVSDLLLKVKETKS